MPGRSFNVRPKMNRPPALHSALRSVLASGELSDFPIGNLPLAEHRAGWVEQLAGKADWQIAENVWLDDGDIAAALAAGAETLVDADGTHLAGSGRRSEDSFSATGSFVLRHPWDLLRANEQWIAALSENQIEGDVCASALIEGYVRIGAGTRILPGVFIEGNVVIGADCKIGPNCYLRGNTSIGSNCHIGQAVELKNSLVLDRTNIGHLSYIGDSIIADRVNLGAGTISSNLRHDGSRHRSLVDGELVDTGRRKFGAVIGSGVHTGIHTSIYPGRKLWPGSSTLPGGVVAQDLPTPG